MTTPFAMERLLLQDGVPPLHTATRPPQLNPTVTGPQSRCDPCISTSDDDHTETDFEIIEVTSDASDSENDDMEDVSSIFSDIDDIESPNPYPFYVLPLVEEQDDVEDAFLLVMPYWRDGQLNLSLFLNGDQIYPWNPINPDPYDYVNQDGMHTECNESDSEPPSMINSAVLDPFNFAANREGSGGHMMWSMSMSNSSISSSRMNCSGWSGSASMYLKYAGTHLNDMVDGHMENFPEILCV